MKYVGQAFSMEEGETYVIQGVASVYTYVNSSNQPTIIHGSNDGQIWGEITQIAPLSSDIQVHSFLYLRCTGGNVDVNRGVGGNSTQPPSGGGDYSFSVSDLDLSATALKDHSILNITPDVVANHHIVGTNHSGTVTANQSPLSVYWKYLQGKFKFTPNPAEVMVLTFRDEEPTEVFIPSSNLSFLYFMSGDGATNVGIVMADGSSSTFPIGGYQDGMEIAFEIDGLDLNIYASNQKIGTHQLTAKLGTFIQTINMPGMPFTSLNYDLTESYADITYQLPSDAKDGDIYYITSHAELFGKKLLANDFIQVYDNKTKIMVNRFKSESKTVLNVESMKMSNTSNIFAYYDPDLKTIHLSGNFYSGTQTVNEGLFKVKVDDLAVGLDELPVFAYSGTGIATLTATFNSGYIEINNPNAQAYGQHVLFDTVIGRIQ